MTDWTLEIAKLGTQLVGALGISWLTVRWALGRYKSEKMWERETGAIVDLLAAIDAMEEITDAWWEEEVSGRVAIEDLQTTRRERYWAERSRARSVAAIASVVLPKKPAEAARQLIRKLETRVPDHEGWMLQLEANGEALKEARASLIDFSRLRKGANQ